MGILAALSRVLTVALAGATLVACYEPTLRDCTVSCNASTECAAEQRCHDGWCVAPGATCSDDDPPIDGRVDAPPMKELRIEVKGRGRVDGDQGGVSCSGPDGDCRFDLPVGTVLELTPVDGDDTFYRWRDACDGQGATCTLTLDAPRRAKAEFTH